MALTQRAASRIGEGDLAELDMEGLVPWIAAGNEPATCRFYEATSGLVFGLLLLSLGDTTTADEVLVGVYAEVKEQAARFHKKHERLLPWLITITHRHVLEHLYSTSDDREFTILIGLPGGPDRSRIRRFAISKSAHRRLVDATLCTISAAEWKMLELVYFSRMTPRAVATKRRETLRAVETGLQHGVSQLYSLFNKQGFPGEA